MNENEKPKTPQNAVEAIGNPLHQVLRGKGITPEYLAGKLKDELEAEKTEFAKFEGKICDEKNVIDWNTRQKARQDAITYLGLKPVEQHQLTFIPQFSDEDREALKNLSSQVIDAIIKQHHRDLTSDWFSLGGDRFMVMGVQEPDTPYPGPLHAQRTWISDPAHDDPTSSQDSQESDPNDIYRDRGA